MTKMKTIVLTIAAMGVLSAPVLATVIAPAFDDMSTSPQDQGFSCYGGCPSGSSIGGEWNMVIEGGGGLERYAPAMDVPDSGDYTFTFSGRVNANSSSANNSLKFGVDEQSSGNSDFYKGIYFEETLSQVLGAGSGDSYSVDTSVNHNYQIIRESGVTSLYVDGGLAISDLPATPGSGGDNHEGLFVGSASRSISSNSTWTLWQLEDGAHVIPEPASMMLLAAGGLLVISRRRRSA